MVLYGTESSSFDTEWGRLPLLCECYVNLSLLSLSYSKIILNN
jgi:hypothetical protein